MTIAIQPINASQDFLDALNPKKSLRKWLQQALADDDLALFFMYTDPPTVEECNYGVQFIDRSTLPLAPRTFESRTYGHSSSGYLGALFMGFTDAATILSNDWVEDFEKVSQLTGAPLEHDGKSTINLVPSADVKQAPIPIRFDNLYTRAGVDIRRKWTVRPYKWAVLARKSAFNPRLRSWHSGNHSADRENTYYHAEHLLFDFRGGIPLTVGSFGSEADVWLGEQRSYVEDRKARDYEYPSSVEVGRIHVPSLGDITNVTV